MIEIAICDDDVNDLELISKIVCDICLDEAVEYNLKTYSSGEEMMSQTYSIDIGILDIAMSGLNGIELGIELKKKFPEVKLIYISRHEQYCQQVVNDVHAFSFLTKPVKYEDVKQQIIDILDRLDDDISGRKREFYNVTASDNKELEVIKLNLKDIIYFEYIKTTRRIKIVCMKDSYEFTYVMEKLTDELKESGFEVNCRGMLVNMRHIRKVKGYSLYMDNGQELRLSQKRKADFVKKMNVFMHNNFSFYGCN